jgi:hypothetical protein
MDKVDKYITNLLTNELADAKKKINKLQEDIERYIKLPNNCLGIDIDGLVCENPNYKLDMLTNLYHQQGYWNGVAQLSKNLIMFRGFSELDLEQFLIKQEEIKKHNKKVMDDLLNTIKSKNPNLYNKNDKK